MRAAVPAANGPTGAKWSPEVRAMFVTTVAVITVGLICFLVIGLLHR